MQTSPPVFEFGPFRIDAAKRLLHRRDGTHIPLTSRVFDTLLYLVEHSGEVVERERLMDAIWPDTVVEENNLTQNISTLRRLLGDAPGSHRFIVTVPGRGYRFVAEVRACRDPEPEAQEIQSAPVAADPASRPAVLIPQKKRLPAWAVGIVAMIVLLGLASFFLRHGTVLPAAESKKTIAALPSEIPGETKPAPPDRSIAVLPFENLSSDPENAYFAGGIRDEILTRLSKVGALKVISSTSPQKYKSAPENLREIAQTLGVAHILEGSVQRSGDRVRVNVQLIHASGDTHIWAETYDRKLTDMFQVESDIAQRVATALAATLTGSETRAIQARPTENPAAHEAYLKGRHFWNKRTAEGYRRAVEFFQSAIENDPSYAQAYAGLADALLFLGGENAPNHNETLARGRATLRKAIELDETLAEAHASIGLNAMNFDWDWATAEREFKRALELNPNYATAHQWYGEFLANMGRFDEGIAEIKRAHELDPLSLIISTDVGKVYMIARHYDEAIAQFQKTLEIDPTFAVAHGLLGLTLSLAGRHEEAAAEMRQINLAGNPNYLSWMGYIDGAAGRKSQAEEIIKQLNELAQRNEVSPIYFAIVHAGMGEKDETFKWFEKVLAERAPWGAVALRSPLFDTLRADPRYGDLLRRTNLPP